MRINIGRLFLALIGQGLIFVFFLLIFPLYFFGGEPSVMWLDLAVVSIVYWIWVLNAGIAPVDKDDPSQKGIGGLGIRLYGSVVYTVCALGFIVLAVTFTANESHIAFKWQILVQAILLFCFMCWLYSSNLASRHTGEVYREEMQKKEGKIDLKNALSKLVALAEDNSAPGDIQEKLRELSSSTRFLTPSNSAEAKNADLNILNECSRLSAQLLDPSMNGKEIEEATAKLQRLMERRKKIN